MTSDVVKIAVANGVVSILGMIISGVIAILLKRMNDKADVAAEAVRSVKIDLKHNDQNFSSKLLDIKRTTEATHLLVNSAMCDQLRITAAALRRIADFTGMPEDITLAKAAEKALAEIIARQA